MSYWEQELDDMLDEAKSGVYRCRDCKDGRVYKDGKWYDCEECDATGYEPIRLDLR